MPFAVDTSAPPDAFDVFVSYHSGDADWVVALKTALESAGVRVWLDRDQIRGGDRFVSRLEQALNSVRCVILVVSPGSLGSDWVQDEYHFALRRGNTGTAALRLIPVLIDDAELPGFLANRNWVDFRDATQFAEKLDELVFGITGRRVRGAGGGSAADQLRRDDPAPVASPGVDEVECVARMIARAHADARRLRRMRLLAVIPGLLIVGAFAVYFPESPKIVRAALFVAVPCITGLIALATTASSLDQCDRNLARYEVLRDGLEACRARSAPGCTRLRATFWEIMQRRTSELATGPGERA